MSSEGAEITKLLADIRAGNREASSQLMDAVYSDLRGMARRLFLRERPGHTLQPTALVHEAWIRLFSGTEIPGSDRLHFYAVAARQMRRLLVDYSREFQAQKRGGGLKVTLDDNFPSSPLTGCDFDEVNELLKRLERTDPEAAKVVEMKFFAGMTDREAAAAMGCSQTTVRRHWSFAKAWLLSRMTGAAGNEKND